MLIYLTIIYNLFEYIKYENIIKSEGQQEIIDFKIDVLNWLIFDYSWFLYKDELYKLEKIEKYEPSNLYLFNKYDIRKLINEFKNIYPNNLINYIFR